MTAPVLDGPPGGRPREDDGLDGARVVPKDTDPPAGIVMLYSSRTRWRRPAALGTGAQPDEPGHRGGYRAVEQETCSSQGARCSCRGTDSGSRPSQRMCRRARSANTGRSPGPCRWCASNATGRTRMAGPYMAEAAQASNGAVYRTRRMPAPCSRRRARCCDERSLESKTYAAWNIDGLVDSRRESLGCLPMTITVASGSSSAVEWVQPRIGGVPCRRKRRSARPLSTSRAELEFLSGFGFIAAEPPSANMCRSAGSNCVHSDLGPSRHALAGALNVGEAREVSMIWSLGAERGSSTPRSTNLGRIVAADGRAGHWASTEWAPRSSTSARQDQSRRRRAGSRCCVPGVEYLHPTAAMRWRTSSGRVCGNAPRGDQPEPFLLLDRAGSEHRRPG